MKRNHFLFIITLCICLLTYTSLVSAKEIIEVKGNTPKEHKYVILVDLNEHQLYLINNNTKIIEKAYPIAGGKPSTPSPMGTWTIVDKAVGWGGGFGTRWMMLNVPWGKYGIHGTNKPLSVGGYVGSAISLGCIRMLNKDVEELYKIVDIGTNVIIYGGPYGLYTNQFRHLKPGDRGSDVYEVQKRMKERGYYSQTVDGVYGEGMKAAVIKFRKDNKLRIIHDIDKDFYNKLEIKAFE